MPSAFTIVVVEDNPINRNLFRALLQKHDCTIIEVDDGLQALSVISQHLPDVIILDIQLPNRSGIEIARDLKADVATASIPIIAVTAFATLYDKQQVLGSGCDLYLAKPFKVDDFYKALHACLDIGKVAHRVLPLSSASPR